MPMSQNLSNNTTTSPTRFAHRPYAAEILPEPDLRLRDVVVHTHLVGKLRFVQYGDIQETNVPQFSPPTAVSPSCSLFLGQVRYEITSGLLAALLRRLLKVSVRRIDPRPRGCFVVTFESPEEVERVRALNKRLLFDNIGVWFANEGQSSFLADYVSRVGRHIAGQSRLPHDCMVVEKCRVPHASSRAETADGTVAAPVERRWSPTWKDLSTPPPPRELRACTPPPPLDLGAYTPPPRSSPPPYGAEWSVMNPHVTCDGMRMGRGV